MTTIRNITLDDLPDVLHMQHLCYDASFHETPASFHAKIAVTPETCWLAIRRDDPLAYLITLPVSYADFPALNSPTFRRSATPDVLYIHDLAVTPDGRAIGLGKTLVKHAFKMAEALQITRIGLIAVQDSVAYWSRYDFANVSTPHPELLAKIRSFGDNACYMEKSIPTISTP